MVVLPTAVAGHGMINTTEMTTRAVEDATIIHETIKVEANTTIVVRNKNVRHQGETHSALAPIHSASSAANNDRALSEAPGI